MSTSPTASPEHTPPRRWIGTLPIVLGLLPAALAFARIRDNYFFTDDFIHFYDFVVSDALTSTLRAWSGHMLIVFDALLRIEFAAFGIDPRPYFLIALALHGLNVVLLYGVLRRVTGHPLLAAFGAAVWGAMPGHQEPIGWVSVHGQLLVATTFLLAWRSVLDWRERPGVVPVRTLLAWQALSIVGSNCHGVGAPLAMLFPLLVLAALPANRLPATRRLVLLLAPAVTLFEYLVVRPWIGTWIIDPTEGVASISIASANATRVAALSVHLAAVGVSDALLGWLTRLLPWSRTHALVVTTVFGAAALVMGIRGPRAHTRMVAALLALTAGIYGAVALGREGVYDWLGLDPMRAAEAGRYHYLATLPVVAAACLLLADAAGARIPPRVARGAFALALALLGAANVVWPPFIEAHEDNRREVTTALVDIHARILGTPPGQEVVLRNRAFGPTILGYKVFPGLAGVFILHQPTNVVFGRRIYFTDKDEAVQDAQLRGGRLATLLRPRPAPP